MRLSIAVLLMSAVVACSTGSTRPADVPRADVTVTLNAPLFFGSGRVAPAAFDVSVMNQATVPISVRSIQMSTPAMVQYTIRPVDRLFNEILAPDESKTFHILTSAVASTAGPRVSEPMNVRVEVDFETAGRRYREVYNIMHVGQ